eukprot:TRINITY_DN8263_c0_g2_i2.p3 TRINITY_DN8263_c0_g2~~TRINITY_DN8263_c0_g2_i2.p3  ORF type:complete len:188 (-),score=18.70 TRINITY_DN8263_c0_g2_i2:195-758(-)
MQSRLILKFYGLTDHIEDLHSQENRDLQGTQQVVEEMGSQSDNGSASRYKEQMTQRVGKLLKQYIQEGDSDPKLWKVLSRFYKITGDLVGHEEALLKFLRCISGWQKEQEKFVEYTKGSLQLCELYLQIKHCGGENALRQLSSGRMHLRSLLKQTQEQFGETDEYKDVQSKLEQVVKAIEELKEQPS